MIFSLVFCAVLIGALGVVLASPYYFYHKIVSENYRSKWYFLEDYQDEIVTPSQALQLKEPRINNEELWKNFHFKDTMVPLPVRHPLYYTAAVLDYNKERKSTKLGVAVYGTGYREISRLYFVNNMIMANESGSQELFRLPLVKKIIKEASAEQIWRDIFKKDLSSWNIPFSEMVYNLYVLQLRSKLLPKGMINFSALDDNTGVVRLDSANKDYITELVMTRSRGVVYSYIIVTEKNNSESEVLRYKFLRDIRFRPGSEALAGIVYKEFKALTYERQVDHEGMLYLLSAWSHQMANKEFLKEMIFYLERGEDNEKQLKPLYTYGARRYGKVFSRKRVDGVDITGHMQLQRDIELEDRKELERIKASETSAEPAPLTKEQKVRNKIQEAKRSKSIKKNRMILD